MNDIVVRHSREIKELKKTVAKTSALAAKILFAYSGLPDPYTTATKLVYDVQRDVLFKNEGYEWRGTSEHIVTYPVRNQQIIIHNLTNCPIRILDIVCDASTLNDIYINNDDTVVSKDNLNMFIFNEQRIVLKLAIPDGETITVKYTEVG